MLPVLQCAPELLEEDLSGRTYIVTGANSGAGSATAAQLVRQGAHVVAACRRVSAGEEANLVKHTMPTWVQNVLMRPFSRLLGMLSWEEGAQTTLHVLLDDDAPEHSGEYYSQNSIFYADKANQRGGWPMRSPNPLAHDAELARRFYDQSRATVGLEA